MMKNAEEKLEELEWFKAGILESDCPGSNLSLRDFPGGPVVKNLPSNAGDVGSIPGQGTGIPHALGQLSLCAVNY